jgi:hypothetical protein
VVAAVLGAEVELDEVAVAPARVAPGGGAGSAELRPVATIVSKLGARRRVSIRASSSRPTSRSVRPGRSAAGGSSSASARSAIAQASRSSATSVSSLTARSCSTTRRTLTSSPPAASASAACRSTVTSWVSMPSVR